MRTTALAAIVAVCLVAPTLAPAASVEGRWKLDARDRGDHVQLNLRYSWSGGGTFSWTDDFPRSGLRGLPATGRVPDGPASFSLVRDAGTIRLEGRMDHGRGEGSYTFEPDAKFVADLKRAGYTDLSNEQLLRLCVEDLGRSWIEDVRSLGMRDPSLSNLLRLRDNGVKAEYVRGLAAAGYGGLGAEDIIRLRVNDVSPDYVKQLGSVKRWSVEQIVRFRNNGVEGSYASALAPRFEAEDIVRLHNNGVETSFVRDFQALGYESATADDLVRLRNNGVTPAFARRARELHGPVTTEELIKLRVNGVE